MESKQSNQTPETRPKKIINVVNKLLGAVPVIGIQRHRLLTDGQGVVTLVGFYGCPLQCRYCLNPQCHEEDKILGYYSAEKLYEEVRVDDVYFRTTGGGVTFGGGEPLLYSDFIVRFRALCGKKWRLSVETSLNVPREQVAKLVNVVDEWLIDIKDMDNDIYTRYTGKSNAQVRENLNYLAKQRIRHKIQVRIPLIPGYNNVEHQARTIHYLEKEEFRQYSRLTYQKEVQKYYFDEQERGKQGKATCNVLKCLRENIALEYGFPYTSSKCDQETCISGTCPRCEAELQILTEAYYENKDKHSFKRSGDMLARALGGIGKNYFGSDDIPRSILDVVFGPGAPLFVFFAPSEEQIIERYATYLYLKSVDKKQEEK